MEGDQFMEMTVDDDEQDSVLPEKDGKEAEYATTSDDSDESDSDDEESRNNNATRMDRNCQDEEMVSEEEGDVSVDMEEGELVIKDKKKTKKQFSRQQRFLMEQEDKEEIVGEGVDRMQNQMQKCMEEIFNKSGIFQTAQKLQEQLQ